MNKKNNNVILDILKITRAVITDSHIVYTSGKHGSIYINKDAVYLHTKAASKIGKLFAEKFKNRKIDVVVAPAVGGTILSQWTAYHLSLLNKREVLSAYTEKDKGTLASASDSEQIFRRGYDKIVKNKRVLVVEDLTTTGVSVKKVVEAVKKAVGKVIAVCVMVNRDPKNVTSKIIGAPFSALGILRAEAFEEDKCPLCRQGIPINTAVGHGAKYLMDKKAAK
jgi:orotate phosphoribosyltransferase